MGKGPCLLGASFTDPYSRARFLASSQTFCPHLNMSAAGDLLLAALFSAAVTCLLRCLSWSTREFATGLSEFDVWSGVTAGSRPVSKRFGAAPAVEFHVLLCT